MSLHAGLYEKLLTALLAEEVEQLSDLVPDKKDLREPEAADRLAMHLSGVVRRAIETLPHKDRVANGVALARALIELLETIAPKSEAGRDMPTAEVLRALQRLSPDGTPKPIPRPLTPMLDTTLLTNARGEPALMHEIRSEVASADRIDVLMAFVRVSGIRPLLEELQRHCARGRELRVLTTTYTGSTEAKALELLAGLGARVKVSYDTTTTRLHAKAWHFHRASGFSTGYIGSSNLTHSAQVAGLEWNVRVAGARNPTVIERIAAVFDTYWNGGDFVDFEPAQFREQTGAQGPNVTVLSPFEVRPYPFQERLLEQIALARDRGHHRNLLVAATGTGKTVMAAVDYARLHALPGRHRLLFVAHRQEILQQSRSTFRHVMRDGSFGELWVAGHRPEQFEHVFASIQSIRAAGVDNIPPDHFDVIIVDEFHHAAASSYTALLERVQPRELLGLTATPERGDGQSVLEWFGGRIAAELRVWDAIDQQRLSPFSYYGISDDLDLSQIPWRRGRGYDVQGLSNLVTGNEVWASKVIQALEDHVADVQRIRCLGFCVSIVHAEFMARVFHTAGIPSVAVSGDTPDAERKQVLRDLAAGSVNVVFSVDLFNEGVDVPRVDTLLLLRPTDSATLFLQQLGRGLRRHDEKGSCLVLDFVGQHRREFRFDRKLRALLGGSRKELIRQVTDGFPFLPSGCHMQLDRVARDIVLTNLKSSLPSQWKAKVEELRALGDDVSMATFLDETGLDVDDIYANRRSWSELRQDAGLPMAPAGPNEQQLRRAVGRLLHLDDPLRIDFYRHVLPQPSAPPLDQLAERQRRLLAMLTAGSFIKSKVTDRMTTLDEGLRILWDHPQVRREIVSLLEVLSARIGHRGARLDGYPDVPLRVHAQYSRAEIIAAFKTAEMAQVFSWQTGAYHEREHDVHLLPFTLDKTEGDFSPTTRYRDYAISPTLIHWESQAAVRADSKTGRSYQHHERNGTGVMLFARLSAATKTFYFLGPARYVRHEGERPMQIVWRLEHALPGDLFAEFAAAVG